ncbi:UBA and UBX domain-containing protein [Platanthera guangdongensis]|uniref:UBA and UBX domain-containing protein n=1 Tax=Platanthera guangdongensis TaxID=2320717 RepID=A0ABR2MPQ4_9ASPA
MDASKGKEEGLLESFCGITSSSREEALFFLESHNWLLDSALHSYFDNSAGGEGAHFPEDPPQPQTLASQSGFVAATTEESPASLLLARSPVSMSNSRDKKTASRPSGSGPAIRTLADLNRRPSDSGSGSDSDEPEEYYTGGEKSGMLVQNPNRGNHDVDAIFDQARQMGALQGPLENQQPSSSSFSGPGRLLSGEPVASAPQLPQNTVHNIYFWRSGFSIDDGPLRGFDDPINAPFLESIKKSECPKELAPPDRRSTVHVNLIRRDENYPEPVESRASFQGVGRTLGTGGSSSSSEPPPSLSSAPTPLSGLSVDASSPLTSIQLRLADGTRMVSRFNLHHTIGDIRAFIHASRPGAARKYSLQAVGFPPKQLNDDSQTIAEAGLANSVVIQKV